MVFEFTADVSAGAWLFMERGIILLEGVLKSLGRIPALISHSEVMGVAIRTFVLRGIWVLIRRFSVPMPHLKKRYPVILASTVGSHW